MNEVCICHVFGIKHILKIFYYEFKYNKSNGGSNESISKYI